MSAGKQKFREEDLATLFAGAKTILVGRGKSFVRFDPATDDATEIATKVLGRSGTLRAPAARAGNTWAVGFADEMWAEFLG